VALDDSVLGEKEERARTWRYHKPRGLVTTHNDPLGRQTVFGTLPTTLPRVISVGRLDAESEGLLLLTMHGSLARSLELPSSGLERVYHCKIDTGQREVSASMLDELRSGLTLADGTRLRPMLAEDADGPHGGQRSRGRPWMRMLLTEGKNLQDSARVGALWLRQALSRPHGLRALCARQPLSRAAGGGLRLRRGSD